MQIFTHYLNPASVIMYSLFCATFTELRVRSRIDYDISSLCFNTFTNSSPVCIAQLLTVYTPSRHIRSSSDIRTLCIPFVKTKSFCQRAFSFTGPSEWNLLPYGLRHYKSSPAFETALKTHLFRSAC